MMKEKEQDKRQFQAGADDESLNDKFDVMFIQQEGELMDLLCDLYKQAQEQILNKLEKMYWKMKDDFKNN